MRVSSYCEGTTRVGTRTGGRAESAGEFPNGSFSITVQGPHSRWLSGSFGPVAHGFDVVAVRVTHESSEITIVVLRPEARLVKHFGAQRRRRVMALPHGRAVGGHEGDVRFNGNRRLLIAFRSRRQVSEVRRNLWNPRSPRRGFLQGEPKHGVVKRALVGRSAHWMAR